MISDMIYNTLQYELQRQSQLCDQCQQELTNAPPGYLYLRDTGRSLTSYQIIKEGQKSRQVNISDQPDLIDALLRKTQNKNTQRACRNNIKAMKKLIKNYQSVVPEQVLSEKQQRMRAVLYKNKCNVPYMKAAFNPQYHIHATINGELTRSKSEVIIANALWHFGIPYNYEELFPYKNSDGHAIYPDFTIHCPDGTVIIWEHWGMLNKEDYCLRNASKLHTFNKHNYIIGKNLIITQDDAQGACNTAMIYHIIETYILPHFQ